MTKANTKDIKCHDGVDAKTKTFTAASYGAICLLCSYSRYNNRTFRNMWDIKTDCLIMSDITAKENCVLHWKLYFHVYIFR